MHVKHFSSVTFYYLSNRYLPNVMKISAKINTMQNINKYNGNFSPDMMYNAIAVTVHPVGLEF